MDFIAATEKGKNGVWRYVAGFATILFFWFVLGSIPVLAAFAWALIDNDPATTIDPQTGMIQGVDTLLGGYLIPNLSFPFFLLGIFLAVRVIHRRALKTLVTPAPSIDWGRVRQGFGLWLVLAGLATGLEIALYPGAFRWNPVGVGRYLIFLALALVFTPIQTTTEELFFRGYLLQATGRVISTRQLIGRLGAAVVNGVLFAAPHIFNPEVREGPALLMLYFFLMGAFFSWVTLRDGTSELAVGAHAANNLFVALLINFEGSALQTPALVMSTRFDPLFNLVTFLITAPIFAVLVFTAWRREGS